MALLNQMAGAAMQADCDYQRRLYEQMSMQRAGVLMGSSAPRPPSHETDDAVLLLLDPPA